MGKTLYNQVRLKGRFSLPYFSRTQVAAGVGIGASIMLLAWMYLL